MFFPVFCAHKRIDHILYLISVIPACGRPAQAFVDLHYTIYQTLYSIHLSQFGKLLKIWPGRWKQIPPDFEK